VVNGLEKAKHSSLQQTGGIKVLQEWAGMKRMEEAGNTKGESITVPLTSCLTGLESAVSQLTIFVFICKTD